MWDDVTVSYPNPPVTDENGGFEFVFSKPDGTQMKVLLTIFRPNQTLQQEEIDARIMQATRIAQKRLENGLSKFT